MDMDKKKIVQLINAALLAREKAYAPYSGYRVGAALLSLDGSVFTGCNIENASYGGTVCAERTAVFKAVSEGRLDFTAIAIAGGKDDEAPPLSGYAHPCGMCRQVLSEFCSSDMNVIVAKSADDYLIHTLGELIPHGFGPGMLK